jgi:hypothetical protein
MLRKITLGAVALAVLAAAGYVGFLFVVMGPHDALGMLRYDQRHKGALRVGDLAPDAALAALDGRSKVRLSERWGTKPLVLVFGSYT